MRDAGAGFEGERGLGLYTSSSHHTSMPKRKNGPVSVFFLFSLFFFCFLYLRGVRLELRHLSRSDYPAKQN